MRLIMMAREVSSLYGFNLFDLYFNIDKATEFITQF